MKKLITIIIISICSNIANAQAYCQPSGAFGACAITNDFWITGVSFTGTGSTFAYTGGACITSAPYYLNTGYQGDVVAGNTYTLSVTKNGNMWKTYFNVWVDWNNNDTLNNTTPYIENIAPNMILVASGGTTATTPITIPAGVSAGVHRMRVRVQYNVLNANNPCLTTGQAETKDFNLNVTCVPPTVTLTLPSAIDTLCESIGAVTLSGGSPAGGTYSGAGVTGTTFNATTAVNGTHSIKYLYSSGVNCSDSAYANIFVRTCTGIDNYYLNESAIIVAPNPFTEQTTITFTEEQKNVIIKVVDVLGQCVQQITTDNQQLTLDMRGISKGIYFLQIKSDRGIINKRIELK